MHHDTAQGKEKAPLPMKEGAFDVPCDGVKLNFGGGAAPRTKRLLKVRDTGVLASCEALRTSAKSWG